MAARQAPLNCRGHTRPVVHLKYSNLTSRGYFLISACKGTCVLIKVVMKLNYHLRMPK